MSLESVVSTTYILESKQVAGISLKEGLPQVRKPSGLLGGDVKFYCQWDNAYEKDFYRDL